MTDLARESRSEDETTAIGREIGATLAAGAVVLLTGPLGAGKTAFVRGLADGLGADPSDVSSPTFAIMQEYRGRVLLRHVDLYRLAPVEVDDLGLDEFGEAAVLAVEWPDRWTTPPPGAIEIAIERVDDTSRRITIRG